MRESTLYIIQEPSNRKEILMKTLFALLVSAVVFSAAHANAETLPATKYPPLNETLFNSLFQKITPDQMKGNPFTLIRKDCFLITAGTSKSYNSMTAGWGGFGVLWGRDVATVYVRNNRFTYRFLEQDPYYTLSFYDSPERKELMTVFGRTSGRDTDKIKASGFTPVVVPGGGVPIHRRE